MGIISNPRQPNQKLAVPSALALRSCATPAYLGRLVVLRAKGLPITPEAILSALREAD